MWELLIFSLVVSVTGSNHHPQHQHKNHDQVDEEPRTFDPERFKLPVFPSEFEGTIYDSPSELKLIEKDHNGEELNRYIPRQLWFAIRNRNHSLPDHHKGIKKRNPKWKFNYCDNDEKDDYMRRVWGNTSIYAVYDVLNPAISCSRPEIWRLAILYHYGGVYMDDDSTIGVPFDDIVKPKDRYISGRERYDYDSDRCYIDAFRLSKAAMEKRFPSNEKAIKPFNNRFFMNWAIFSAPRHPLTRRVMETIVEIIKAEYKGKPFVKFVGQDRGKRLMCSTTFPISYIAREMILESMNELQAGGGTDYQKMSIEEKTEVAMVNGVGMRSAQFEEKYQADMKAWYNDYLPDHWTKQMNKFKQPYLREYGEPDAADFEGMLIQGPGQLEIFLVHNGTRHGFPNFDTFGRLGYDADQVHDVPHKILWQIPHSDELVDLKNPKWRKENQNPVA